MAVYKRTYKGYSGPLTPEWSRFLVLRRYSFARLFQSKFLIMFMVACFFYPLGCAAFIYLAHNLSFLKTFNIPAGRLPCVVPAFVAAGKALADVSSGIGGTVTAQAKFVAYITNPA